jgi:hypothetical protein
MSCSCCKGALTFDEVRLVKDKLTCGRAVPNQKEQDFRAVSATAYWDIENCKELFGLANDKEALSAAFEAGTGENKNNLLFGSSGILLRTLDHWKEFSTTPSSLLRVCARSSSNRARRHRKRSSAKRRGLKANASTPS